MTLSATVFAAIRDHRLSLIETRVLLAVAGFDHGKGIHPKRETIAARCGYGSVHTVSRAISGLVEKGWLEVEQKRGPNVYRIKIPTENEAKSYPQPQGKTTGDIRENPDLNSDRSGNSIRSGNSYRSGHENIGKTLINSDRSGHSIKAETVTDPVTPKRARALEPKGSQYQGEAEKVIHNPEPEPKPTRLSIKTLPETWRAYCQEKRPDLDPEDTFEHFADYWANAKGAKGKKLDWLATWRTWVRRQGKTTGGAKNGTQKSGRDRPETAAERSERLFKLYQQMEREAVEQIERNGNGDLFVELEFGPGGGSSPDPEIICRPANPVRD